MTEVVYIAGKVRNAGIAQLMEKVDIEGSFAIVTTVQFLDEVNELKDKYTVLGQILGCNTIVTRDQDFDAYLYIGTGKFHPLNLAFTQDKPVYTLNPASHEFSKITEEEITRYHKRKKGNLLKYYAAKKIGIIVSLKSGQNQIRRAQVFKNKLDKEGKKEAYLFLCDNVGKMEDYNDIDCWINTACVRIIEDQLPVPLVNIRDVEKV